MELYFKQRFFSWFDSYDIYYADGSVAYTVKGQLSWGHLLRIYDADGREIGMLKQRLWTFLPKFDLYTGERLFGTIRREFTFFRPHYVFEGLDWSIEGNFLGWDYSVRNSRDLPIAQMSKQLWKWTDTYLIQVDDPANALAALMIALAIDVDKCSSGS